MKAEEKIVITEHPARPGMKRVKIGKRVDGWLQEEYMSDLDEVMNDSTLSTAEKVQRIADMLDE